MKKREPPFFRTVPASPRLCQIREIFSQKIPVIFHIAVFFLPPMALLHDFRIGHLGNLLHAISIDAIVRKVGARGVGTGRQNRLKISGAHSLSLPFSYARAGSFCDPALWYALLTFRSTASAGPRRPCRDGPSLFSRRKNALVQTADRASPILGNVLPGGSWRYAVFGIANRGIVHISARALIFHGKNLPLLR